jgi:hypothetical protein
VVQGTSSFNLEPKSEDFASFASSFVGCVPRVLPYASEVFSSSRDNPFDL